MEIGHVIVVLIVVGVGLWLLKAYAAKVMDPTIVTIIQVLVIVAVVLWLLDGFFGLGFLHWRIGKP